MKKPNKKIVISTVVILAVIVFLFLFFSFRSYSVPAGQGIDHSSAAQIALQHAGITKGKAFLLHTRPEMDDGRWEYEVKFYVNFQEYSYQIDAATGIITDIEVDYIFD